MPELPEVETSCRGIAPHIQGQQIERVTVRQRQLRYPVSAQITTRKLKKQQVTNVSRRGKYVLLELDNTNWLMIHLGMSGNLRILRSTKAADKHDHVDIEFTNQKILRLNDPRRFGCLLWTDDLSSHKLLKHLGVEPLTRQFNPKMLYQAAQSRKIAIKTLLMDSQLVVGVGNIYANEALFQTSIHPSTYCHTLTKTQCAELTRVIKIILKQAIKAGGTSLKDFTNSDGKPGYFKQKLFVYGRTKEACLKCKTPIQQFRQNQRSSFFGPSCQPEQKN
ncbi:bifunctional DNA-formamidopyrimidine glycosylase/DNA-(apurinic or apyrimidinic site) lyase [Piscirickettsia litoralis]|uniref:Formamidopyrimidine-DNA glycosylase n=1 Tax=Piscirickettsia litoralis TaxID=1891921 RepID=A0ABX3A392_9GAMM|nr:bifunctional DNA-formamidopyrimidine glycosylase/DNA-(apurinic or apyrimidinic site) lyase [Piscirickettsia litoralis]ODN43339.1 DNA-formamidopyrimidine glycosylase [Piscirickettsia litoralis]